MGVVRISGAGCLRLVDGEYLSHVAGVAVKSLDVQKTYPVTVNATGGTLGGIPTDLKVNGSVKVTTTPDAEHGAPSSSDFTVINASFDSYNLILYNPTGPVTVDVVFPEAPICLAYDTQVLLADGTTKNIQDVEYTDLLYTYDQFKGQFTKQYPLVIEGPCYNQMARLIFEDGIKLDICGSHTVFNMKTHTFNTVWALDGHENDLTDFVALYYDGEGFVQKRLIGFEKLPDKIPSYNVFTPMGGTIITNGLYTSGNFLFYEDIEKLLKKPDSISLDLNLLLGISALRTEEGTDRAYGQYEELLAKYGVGMPMRLFACSVKPYFDLAEQMGIDFSHSVVNKETMAFEDSIVLKRWKNAIKPFPNECNVMLDDEVIATLSEGEIFTFPDKYQTYYDSSEARIYHAGEQKRIYCSFVLIPYE